MTQDMKMQRMDDPLFRAIRQGTPADIQKHLASGTSPDVPSADGRYRPLIFLAGLNMSETYRGEMLALLLQAGANPAAPNKNGDTPLHEAARRGDTATAAKLLAHGADIHAVNNNGDTALHMAATAACATGQNRMVDFLLSRGANNLLRNKQGKTAQDNTQLAARTTLFGASVTQHLAHWQAGKEPLRARFESIHAKRGLSAAQADDDHDYLAQMARQNPSVRLSARPKKQGAPKWRSV